jgi:hypothetical protein
VLISAKKLTLRPQLEIFSEITLRVRPSLRFVFASVYLYPNSKYAVKELVQNADDAGARKISFCLDRRSHGTSLLAAPQLSQFQGQTEIESTIFRMHYPSAY